MNELVVKFKKSLEEYGESVKAIEKNEIIDYLEGAGEYKIEIHQWVGANAPTDVTQIISEGVYK